MSVQDNPHHQVVILGGGPGGATCAVALRRLGLKDVLIVETGDYDTFRIGESVPPEIRPILSRLDILEGFLAQGHEPCYGSCSYWGEERRGFNDAILSVYGHGWHLDRRRFNRFLAEEAGKAGAKLWVGVGLHRSRRRKEGGYRLTLRKMGKKSRVEARGSDFEIDADFVVDATGARCVFARQRGSGKLNDRPLICLGARFSLKNGSANITKMTHLEAVSYGWWYAARLPGDTLLVSLTTDAQTLKQMGLHHPQRWENALRETPNTARIIGRARIIDTRPKSYPAPSFRLDKIVGSHWLAVGDAASAYDPITSQGIIKSMSDARFAAGTIKKFLASAGNELAIYQRMIADRFTQYTAMRRYFYQLENRWPRSTFWRGFQLNAAKPL